MSANINGKAILPTIFINNKQIKKISYNNNDLLKTDYTLNNINNILSLQARRIKNITDNTTANTASIVSYDAIVDKEKQTITILNLVIDTTFLVASAGTKTIEMTLVVANEHIQINGKYEPTFTFITSLVQSENAKAVLIIDEETLVFTFNGSDKFYNVLDGVTTWAK